MTINFFLKDYLIYKIQYYLILESIPTVQLVEALFFSNQFPEQLLLIFNNNNIQPILIKPLKTGCRYAMGSNLPYKLTYEIRLINMSTYSILNFKEIKSERALGYESCDYLERDDSIVIFITSI